MLQPLRVWAVMSTKGGSAKSHTTIHLAVAAAGQRLRVAVFDTDPQATIARWAGGRAQQTNPLVVQCAVSRLPVEVLNVATYDLAIIDTSPRSDRDFLDVAGLAGLIIIPVRPTVVDLAALEDTLRLIGMAKKTRRSVMFLSVVPTGTDEGDEAAAIVEKMGRLIPQRLWDRVDFRRSVTAGQGVTEYAPKSKAAAEATALFGALREFQGGLDRGRQAENERRSARESAGS
jgi:chromosome partitioning protein